MTVSLTQKLEIVGAKGKGKPKFSFRFQSRGEGPSSHYTLKDENIRAIDDVPEILDTIKPGAELLEDIQNDEETPPEVELETRKHECNEQPKSIAELLDGLQDSTNLPLGNLRKVCFSIYNFQLFALILFYPLYRSEVKEENG